MFFFGPYHRPWIGAGARSIPSADSSSTRSKTVRRPMWSAFAGGVGVGSGRPAAHSGCGRGRTRRQRPQERECGPPLHALPMAIACSRIRHGFPCVFQDPIEESFVLGRERIGLFRVFPFRKRGLEHGDSDGCRRDAAAQNAPPAADGVLVFLPGQVLRQVRKLGRNRARSERNASSFPLAE